MINIQKWIDDNKLDNGKIRNRKIIDLLNQSIEENDPDSFILLAQSVDLNFFDSNELFVKSKINNFLEELLLSNKIEEFEKIGNFELNDNSKLINGFYISLDKLINRSHPIDQVIWIKDNSAIEDSIFVSDLIKNNYPFEDIKKAVEDGIEDSISVSDLIKNDYPFEDIKKAVKNGIEVEDSINMAVDRQYSMEQILWLKDNGAEWGIVDCVNLIKNDYPFEDIKKAVKNGIEVENSAMKSVQALKSFKSKKTKHSFDEVFNFCKKIMDNKNFKKFEGRVKQIRNYNNFKVDYMFEEFFDIMKPDSGVYSYVLKEAVDRQYSMEQILWLKNNGAEWGDVSYGDLMKNDYSFEDIREAVKNGIEIENSINIEPENSENSLRKRILERVSKDNKPPSKRPGND